MTTPVRKRTKCRSHRIRPCKVLLRLALRPPIDPDQIDMQVRTWQIWPGPHCFTPFEPSPQTIGVGRRNLYSTTRIPMMISLASATRVHSSSSTPPPQVHSPPLLLVPARKGERLQATTRPRGCVFQRLTTLLLKTCCGSNGSLSRWALPLFFVFFGVVLRCLCSGFPPLCFLWEGVPSGGPFPRLHWLSLAPATWVPRLFFDCSPPPFCGVLLSVDCPQPAW